MDELMNELLAEVRFSLGCGEVSGDEDARKMIIKKVFSHERSRNLSMDELDAMISRLFFKTRSRLGILQPLMDDADVTEIMVNGPAEIFVERKGRMEKYGLAFDSTEEAEEVMRNIVSFVHREINEMNPIVDARLPDGSRVNCVYKNIALNGPVITIRKFSERYMTVDDLTKGGTISREAASLLKCLVACGYNIFISGGTSTRQNHIFKCPCRFYTVS